MTGRGYIISDSAIGRCGIAWEAGSYTDRISAHGGVISKRRLLSIQRASPTVSRTLFEVLLPVAPPRAHP
jgi:methylated-DNA-[protein]-cysteine S-methyltransferase